MQDGKKQLINYHTYVSHNKIEVSKIIPRVIKKLILRYFGMKFVTSQPVKSTDVRAPALCASWVACLRENVRAPRKCARTMSAESSNTV